MKLILAILLPPVGVFLTSGFGPTLFINIGLCFLGYIPGIVHAVWVVLKSNEQQSMN